MKAVGKESDGYLTIVQAAEELGVSRETVRAWMKSGRLTWKVSRPIRASRKMILRSSLERAFDAECVVCGKVFKSRRPRGARFCCYEHNLHYFKLARRKGTPPGRPPKKNTA